MDDFQFLYGNKEKIEQCVNGAKNVFDNTCLGYWDASNNLPALADGTGVDTTYYIVSVEGSVDLGSGVIDFEIDDYVKYNSEDAIWKKTK